jgi:ribonucleoside-diphosphate reductase alpha chain
MEKPLRNIVRALDTVIEIQEYPVKAAEKQLKRRSVGVGVTNFAYWMAKNGLKYEDEKSLILIDELFEHFQYYLIKASMELAKERGACEWFAKTKYAEGIMPFDNINEEAKNLVKRDLTLDWNWLREQVKLHGMRNSVLSAQMPVESSSMVNNSTNGIEPPRELVTVKTNKSGASTVMVVPEGKKLASKYTLAWDIVDNSCINKIVAVIQKYLDQAISVNHYYNPTLFEGNQIPAKVIIKDIVEFYKLGGKNLYYANTLDAIEVEKEDCESCKL